ncbi:hypothetical protein C8Q74DRAFT_156084 [Fomes fomentarius]|nr:hypothetical protein C8Q74DRAFT_156084 [Fomes fomentarius]
MGRRRHLTLLAQSAHDNWPRVPPGVHPSTQLPLSALHLVAPSVLLMSAAIAWHTCQRFSRVFQTGPLASLPSPLSLRASRSSRGDGGEHTLSRFEPSLPVLRRCCLELHGSFWFLHILVLLFPRDVPQNRNARYPVSCASNEAPLRERQLVVRGRSAGCMRLPLSGLFAASWLRASWRRSKTFIERATVTNVALSQRASQRASQCHPVTSVTCLALVVQCVHQTHRRRRKASSRTHPSAPAPALAPDPDLHPLIPILYTSALNTALHTLS